MISWFDFATAIRDMTGSACEVIPQPASAYPTAAKRPAYAIMDSSDMVKDFGIEMKEWQKSLAVCMDKIQMAHG